MNSRDFVTDFNNRKPTEEYLQIFANILDKFANLPKPPMEKSSQFHALKVPSISLFDYLKRINKYAEPSCTVYVLALIYIDRIIKNHPHHINFEPINMHRLILLAIMTGAKFFDDQFYNNTFYAKVGGIEVKELNRLEVEFLFLINFDLYVSSSLFKEYDYEINKQISAKQFPPCTIVNTSTASSSLTTALKHSQKKFIPDTKKEEMKYQPSVAKDTKDEKEKESLTDFYKLLFNHVNNETKRLKNVGSKKKHSRFDSLMMNMVSIQFLKYDLGSMKKIIKKSVEYIHSLSIYKRRSLTFWKMPASQSNWNQFQNLHRDMLKKLNLDEKSLIFIKYEDIKENNINLVPDSKSCLVKG